MDECAGSCCMAAFRESSRISERLPDRTTNTPPCGCASRTAEQEPASGTEPAADQCADAALLLALPFHLVAPVVLGRRPVVAGHAKPHLLGAQRIAGERI